MNAVLRRRCRRPVCRQAGRPAEAAAAEQRRGARTARASGAASSTPPRAEADGVDLLDEADRAALAAGGLAQRPEVGADLAGGRAVVHRLERRRRRRTGTARRPRAAIALARCVLPVPGRPLEQQAAARACRPSRGEGRRAPRKRSRLRTTSSRTTSMPRRRPSGRRSAPAGTPRAGSGPAPADVPQQHDDEHARRTAPGTSDERVDRAAATASGGPSPATARAVSQTHSGSSTKRSRSSRRCRPAFPGPRDVGARRARVPGVVRPSRCPCLVRRSSSLPSGDRPCRRGGWRAGRSQVHRSRATTAPPGRRALQQRDAAAGAAR